MNEIRYEVGTKLDTNAFLELLNASTLGERRPVHDRDVMNAILEHGDVIVSAWDGAKLERFK